MTGQKPRLKPLQLILCDDVRVEATGKYILVGVYSDGIAVSEFPAQINIALWITFEMKGTGMVPVEIEVRGPTPGNKIGISANANLNPKGSEQANKSRIVPLAIGNFPFIVTEPGHVIIAYRQSGEEWKTIRTFPVEKLKINPQP